MLLDIYKNNIVILPSISSTVDKFNVDESIKFKGATCEIHNFEMLNTPCLDKIKR